MKWMKYLQSIIGYKSYSNSSENYLKRCRLDLTAKVKRVLMSCTTVPQMQVALKYAEMAEMEHLELYQQLKEFKNHVTEGL